MARNSVRLYAVSNRMIVGFHPEKPVPYEFTRPMPARIEDETSILKEVPKDIFNAAPNLEQIQALTYTPKRYWIDRTGHEKRVAYKKAFDQKKDERN